MGLPSREDSPAVLDRCQAVYTLDLSTYFVCR